MKHDDSYLQDDDLNHFTPDGDNPTFVLTDEAGEMVGASSLLCLARLRNAGKARFRILHAADRSPRAYRLLLGEFESRLQGINLFLFLPDKETAVGEILKGMGFAVERYAWILRRTDMEVALPVFEPNYMLAPFRKNHDEAAWCAVCNNAYSPFNWYNPILPDMVECDESSEHYLPNGLQMLWCGESPAGILRVEQLSAEQKAEVTTLAIDPRYQEKQLGRNLLRAGLRIALEAGYRIVNLSVNGDNPKAAGLYLSEGFHQEKLMLCYSKNLP